jgi:hypothetical protein
LRNKSKGQDLRPTAQPPGNRAAAALLNASIWSA